MLNPVEEFHFNYLRDNHFSHLVTIEQCVSELANVKSLVNTQKLNPDPTDWYFYNYCVCLRIYTDLIIKKQIELSIMPCRFADLR